MVLSINLTQEQADFVTAQAQREGVSTEEYARRIISPPNHRNPFPLDSLPEADQADVRAMLAADDPIKAFVSWIKANGLDKSPPIPLEALSREKLYERDEDE